QQQQTAQLAGCHARRTRPTSKHQNHSRDKKKKRHVTDQQLPKHKLKNSHSTPDDEHQWIHSTWNEVGVTEVGVAHPALGCVLSAEIPAELTNLSHIKERTQTEGRYLTGNPGSNDAQWRTLTPHSPKGVNPERWGKQKSGKMRTDGKPETHAGKEHCSSRIPGQAALDQVCRAHGESQEQCILANFGRKFNGRR